MMTKKEIYTAMGGRISMSSIREYSDEFQILGKYGMVSWMGDYWDVWITNIHSGVELSSRKVKHLCEALKPLAKSIDTGFTGEAVAIVPGNEEAYLCAVLLGARKRRKDTPETLAKNRARLANYRGSETERDWITHCISSKPGNTTRASWVRQRVLTDILKK